MSELSSYIGFMVIVSRTKNACIAITIMAIVSVILVHYILYGQDRISSFTYITLDKTDKSRGLFQSLEFINGVF